MESAAPRQAAARPGDAFLRSVFCTSRGLIFVYACLLISSVGVVVTLTPSLYVRVFAASLNHTTFADAPEPKPYVHFLLEFLRVLHFRAVNNPNL